MGGWAGGLTVSTRFYSYLSQAKLRLRLSLAIILEHVGPVPGIMQSYGAIFPRVLLSWGLVILEIYELRGV